MKTRAYINISFFSYTDVREFGSCIYIGHYEKIYILVY
jgi:hypothetical protein